MQLIPTDPPLWRSALLRPTAQANLNGARPLPLLLDCIMAMGAEGLKRSPEESDRVAAMPFDVIDGIGLRLSAYPADWLGLEDFRPDLFPLRRLV